MKKGNLLCMLTLSRAQLRRCRGIIVWDFDGVLFETERYRLDNRLAWIKRGVPEEVVVDIIEDIRKRKKHFSIAEFARLLKKRKYRISEKFIRRVFHRHLVENEYYSPETDRLLHRLKRRGFTQMILSMGSAPFQYKKMFVGCGSYFRKHFAKTIVTTRPKYLTLATISTKHPHLPLFFIDDTKEHLELAKKYVPRVITIYYSNLSKKSLRSVENRILQYAKTR